MKGVAMRVTTISAAVAAVFAVSAHAAPTVAFKAPLNGATISGTISGSSGCSVTGSNIARADFYLDSKLVSSDGIPSTGVTCLLDTTKFADGAHALKAVVFDSAGSQASSQISVNIKNGTTTGGTTTGGTTSGAPTRPIQMPAEGGTLSGIVQGAPKCIVTGTNLVKVSFYLNGVLTNTDGNLTNGLGCWMDTTKYANGTYTVKAVGYNAAGATVTVSRGIVIQNGTTT